MTAIGAGKKEIIDVSIRDTRMSALLGESPRVTLSDGNDPGLCLSVHLVKSGRVWLGIVDDGAAILDRVRMGLKPRFVVHPDASTSTVSGELDVRVLGRADSHEFGARVEQPFGLAGAVVIEVTPRGLVLEPAEPPLLGAVPRT